MALTVGIIPWAAGIRGLGNLPPPLPAVGARAVAGAAWRPCLPLAARAKLRVACASSSPSSPRLTRARDCSAERRDVAATLARPLDVPAVPARGRRSRAAGSLDRQCGKPMRCRRDRAELSQMACFGIAGVACAFSVATSVLEPSRARRRGWSLASAPSPAGPSLAQPRARFAAADASARAVSAGWAAALAPSAADARSRSRRFAPACAGPSRPSVSPRSPRTHARSLPRLTVALSASAARAPACAEGGHRRSGIAQRPARGRTARDRSQPPARPAAHRRAARPPRPPRAPPRARRRAPRRAPGAPLSCRRGAPRAAREEAGSSAAGQRHVIASARSPVGRRAGTAAFGHGIAARRTASAASARAK